MGHAVKRTDRSVDSPGDLYRQAIAWLAGKFAAARLRRADARRWRSAASLADLGELVIAWMHRELADTPAHHGMDPETIPLIPALTAVNRAGFITDNSQLAETTDYGTWNTWVTGFATDTVLARVRTAAAGTELTVTGCRGREHSGWHPWPIWLTKLTGWGCPGRTALSFWADACPAVADDLERCWYVRVTDPEPGRNDLLWSTLAGM